MATLLALRDRGLPLMCYAFLMSLYVNLSLTGTQRRQCCALVESEGTSVVLAHELGIRSQSAG